MEKRKGIDRYRDRWAPIQNRKKTLGIPFESAGEMERFRAAIMRLKFNN